MMDEELQRLCAFMDGESTEAECRDMEAELDRNPALRKTLAVFAKLKSAAQNESVPSVTFGSEKIWPIVSERASALSEDVLLRLRDLAVNESTPVPQPERFNEVWKSIKLQTAASGAVPEVKAEQWQGVWKQISARTALPETERTPAKIPATIPVESHLEPHRAQKMSTWFWAAGIGVAASIALVVLLRNSLPEIPQVPWNNAAAHISTVSIPETQDDHYGVRVRFVPGSSDPVVTLYYKNPPQREDASGGVDSDPQK